VPVIKNPAKQPGSGGSLFDVADAIGLDRLIWTADKKARRFLEAPFQTKANASRFSQEAANCSSSICDWQSFAALKENRAGTICKALRLAAPKYIAPSSASILIDCP
jgi:hypothetical protein